MFCLPLYWLYIVFYDYAVLILFLIFFFFFICLWFLTGTSSDFPVFFGGVGSSVWPLWPPCQFSGICLPSIDISRHENRAQIQAVTILHPLLVCLILSLCAGLTERDHGKTDDRNINQTYFSCTLGFRHDRVPKTRATYQLQTHLLLLKLTTKPTKRRQTDFCPAALYISFL